MPTCLSLWCVLCHQRSQIVTDSCLQAEKVTSWVRPLEGSANGIVVTLPAKYRVGPKNLSSITPTLMSQQVPDDYYHVVKPKIKRKIDAAGDAEPDTR